MFRQEGGRFGQDEMVHPADPSVRVADTGGHTGPEDRRDHGVGIVADAVLPLRDGCVAYRAAFVVPDATANIVFHDAWAGLTWSPSRQRR